MVVSRDETIDSLKGIIGNLESRVGQLEHRLLGNDKPQSLPESMRMILIGPPGAGTSFFISFSALFVSVLLPILPLTRLRQGNPGAQDQGKVLRLPFGECAFIFIH